MQLQNIFVPESDNAQGYSNQFIVQPVTVSPGAGMRSDLTTMSVFTLPTTTIFGVFMTVNLL